MTRREIENSWTRTTRSNGFWNAVAVLKDMDGNYPTKQPQWVNTKTGKIAEKEELKVLCKRVP